MARNKKNKKKQVQEESESEGSDSGSETEVVDPASHEEEEKKEKASDAESESEHSEADSDDGKKKKKVYRGNKAEKGGGKGKSKKKGGNEEPAKKESKTKAANDGDDDEEEIVITRQEPIQVLYCPICTFPAEMCEFSGMMEKCRPWLQEHAAELAEAEEKGRKRRILTEKERLEALLEGRGVKKALERMVLLTAQVRTGKRMITSIYGLDLFGFNLKDVAKEFRKTFSSGGGVRAAAEGETQDCVEIQGNVVDQLAVILTEKYKIPKDCIYVKENKQKRKYFS